MKNAGLDLDKLATRIMLDAENKADFMVNGPALSYGFEEGQVPGFHSLELRLQEKKDVEPYRFGMNDLFHLQAGEKMGIPRKYYQRMLVESPELLVTNMNHWFAQSQDKFLLRTLHGDARSFLSDRYRFYDYDIIGMGCLGELNARANLVTADITDTHMYIDAVCKNWEGEVQPGDPIKGGLGISTSEVGCGAFEIWMYILRLACKNGLKRKHKGTTLRKIHLGRKYANEFTPEEMAQRYKSDETREAENRAFMLAVRDMVKAAFDEETWKYELEQMRKTVQRNVPAELVEPMVQVVQNRYSLSEKERETFFANLLSEKAFNQWTIVNSITALANMENISYDHANDMEQLGGKILDENEWAELMRAAEREQEIVKAEKLLNTSTAN